MNLSKAKGTKLQITDNIAIACQSKNLTQGEKTLNEDIEEFYRYFLR